MRFLHLSDLHLGKSLYGVSLMERGDQPRWVERFLALAREVKPDAVVIAGDVYDRSAPSGETVLLLDHMLTELARLDIPVLLVAGNHDSGQRLSFGRELLAKQKLHIAGVLEKGGALERVTLPDAYGSVTFWLMPYVFPALVAQALGVEELRDYDAAVRRLLAAQPIDFSGRNVIIAHQNVTAAGAESVRGGSETMVGGLGQVDSTAFDGFEYAALGHIHAAYPVGREGVRFAGSPLCYHFNETRQPRKGPVLVTLGPKGTEPKVETLFIPPLHPMRELRGPWEELRAAAIGDTARDEYLRVVLTDTRNSPEISDFFHNIYEARGSVVMEIVSEYREFGGPAGAADAAAVREKSVEELFSDFYTERSGGAAPGEKDAALLRYAGELSQRADVHAAPDAAQIEALLTYLLKQEGSE